MTRKGIEIETHSCPEYWCVVVVRPSKKKYNRRKNEVKGNEDDQRKIFSKQTTTKNNISTHLYIYDIMIKKPMKLVQYVLGFQTGTFQHGKQKDRRDRREVDKVINDIEKNV